MSSPEIPEWDKATLHRLSQAARFSLLAARLHVSDRGSDAIEPEHLLLGLLEAKGSIAHRVLSEGAVPVESITEAMPLAVGVVRLATHIEVPFSAAAIAVLSAAADEAGGASGTSEVTTGHLLLGILRDEQCVASKALRHAGVVYENIKAIVEVQPIVRPEGISEDAGHFMERFRPTLGT